jgi:translation elongation factor EF-1alpha
MPNTQGIGFHGRNLSRRTDFASVVMIPISASRGHNILEPSSRCMWYEGWERNGLSGKTLLDALDSFA